MIIFIQFFWTILVGLTVGSFLNVCIYRIPRGESIISPASHCDECGSRINWYDNIPVFSYLILKGRCRNCGGSISISSPIVEILAAVIPAVTLSVYGFSKDFFLFSVLFLTLIPIAFIDFTENIIPDSIIIFGTIAGLIFSFTGGIENIVISTAGGLVGAVSLYVIRFLGNILLKKESMGLGDIKLGGMLGIYLGSKLIILAIYISFLITLIYGIVIILKKRSMTTNPLPFGTFLALGTLFTVFFANYLITFYHYII